MAEIEQLPLIPPNTVIRNARQTRQAGAQVLNQLIEEGRIDPEQRPNGRRMLTWVEVRVFWDALHRQS